MIFPILKSDLVVQAGDKLRLDASKSFTTPGEHTIVSGASPSALVIGQARLTGVSSSEISSVSDYIMTATQTVSFDNGGSGFYSFVVREFSTP